MLSSIASLTLADFLAGIASEAPAPGAGSAAAVALALGLACACKAIALTLKHHPDAHELIRLGDHLSGLTEQAIAGGEADMRCFSAYIAAMALPKGEAGRDPAMQDALVDLVAVGENLVAIGDEARRKLLEVKTDIYKTMINDVAAALALIAAARSIHTACVAESGRSLNP